MNLTFVEMLDIQKNFKQAAINVEQMSITGTRQTIDDVWYLIVDDKEITKIHDDIKNHLNINYRVPEVRSNTNLGEQVVNNIAAFSLNKQQQKHKNIYIESSVRQYFLSL